MGWLNRGVTITALAVLAGVAAAYGALADTVEMKDGTLIRGKYVGGTSTTVRVDVENGGGVKVLETAGVLAITFGDTVGGAAAATAAAPAAAAQPAAAQPAAAAALAAPAASPQRVQVAAGTVLTIRLDGPVSSQSPEGTKFTGKLLADLTAQGATVAKANSTVFGQVDKSKQAGRAVGKSELVISLTGIDLGNGTIQPIMTTNFAETGKSSFRKTARNTAAGALIGKAADDDDGAKKGAAIGAGVSLIRKGDSVTAPAGMILEFRVSQPFEAPVTK